jgi:hypothetical protein
MKVAQSGKTLPGRGAMAAVAIVIAGCANPPPISLDQSFWQNKAARVAVATAPLPVAGTAQRFGSQGAGWLDQAIAATISENLNRRLATVDTSRIDQLPNRLAATLRGRGIYARTLERRVDVAAYPAKPAVEGYEERDFSALGKAEGVDHLLLVTVMGVGAERGFYAFIPATAPSGRFYAIGELIDIASRKILWRREVEVTRPVASPWDQPPDYPNVLKAMDSAITAGTNLILTDFSWFAR